MKTLVALSLLLISAIGTSAQTKQYLTYDDVGRIASAVYIRGTEALRINYSYDNRGHLSSRKVEKVTTVEERDESVDITFSPNPVQHDCALRIHANAGEAIRVVITNAEGVEVRTLDISADANGLATTSVSVGDLASGVYFATIERSSDRLSKAFVVSK